MRTRSLIGLVAVTASIVAAGCGDDDGADVRERGTATGSATGSGSATHGSSGSATGSATGTGVAGACKPIGDLASAATRVNVALDEWTIEPEVDAAPAGAVGFVARNQGEEPHELVVIKGVAAADLPLKRNGSLDEEELPAGALIGEIESFPAGTSCNGVFELMAGEYTLVCNIVEKEDGHVHLAKGMVTTFTVT
jgi:hypothetical protein